MANGGQTTGPGWLATCCAFSLSAFPPLFLLQTLSCLFPPFSSTVRLANPLSADDSTLLLWDLTSTTPNPPSASRSAPTSPKVLRDPAFSYTAPGEINAVAWGGGGEWVAAGCGRLVRCLR